MKPNDIRRLAVRFAVLAVGSAALVAATGMGTNDDTPATGPSSQPSPSLRPVQDDPKLPRVLLIGDSISMGYTVRVRKELDGVANVHRPLTNCGSTSRGIANLDQWLAGHNTGGPSDRPWDVIHFNFGLHDLKYIDGRGSTVAASTGRQNVPPERYEENLRAIVERLQATGATLVWASTTPVQDVMPGHLSADVVKYNQIARRVMTEKGVAINDLYALVLPRLEELQLPANVHFRGSGSDVLADQVKTSIAAALARREAK